MLCTAMPENGPSLSGLQGREEGQETQDFEVGHLSDTSGG